MCVWGGGGKYRSEPVTVNVASVCEVKLQFQQMCLNLSLSPWLVPEKENSEHAPDKSCSKIDVIFQDPEE